MAKSEVGTVALRELLGSLQSLRPRLFACPAQQQGCRSLRKWQSVNRLVNPILHHYYRTASWHFPL